MSDKLRAIFSNPAAENCLSHWFPKIEAAGLPVPETRMVTTGPNLALISLLDGETPAGYEEFMAELRAAVVAIGTPCFLRTGQGSDKHSWQDTCYLEDAGELPMHVFRLVEW